MCICKSCTHFFFSPWIMPGSFTDLVFPFSANLSPHKSHSTFLPASVPLSSSSSFSPFLSSIDGSPTREVFQSLCPNPGGHLWHWGHRPCGLVYAESSLLPKTVIYIHDRVYKQQVIPNETCQQGNAGQPSPAFRAGKGSVIVIIGTNSILPQPEWQLAQPCQRPKP